MKAFKVALFVFTLCLVSNPTLAQHSVHIQVEPDSIHFLELDPFLSRDVLGNFIGSDGVERENVDVNFRGAYALRFLIKRKYKQRNWKIKVAKSAKYRNRREWNYNYEVELRHRLSHNLFAAAGVPTVSARNVNLFLNGDLHGLYTEFEDPDNKDWLKEVFGDNDGDLYKASYTIPNEPRQFAKLNYLGDQDSSYFLHYRKKTNKKGDKEFDYSSIRRFIYQLNFIEDEHFVDSIQTLFEVDEFIRYLVVQNFISHWDSYPQRPKNYWLYQNPETDKWSFIPWDLDNTFQNGYGNLNKMGNDVSVFYQFDSYESIGSKHEQEYNERPLVRRLMGFPQFRNRYINSYKYALNHYLAKDTILSRIEAIKQEVKQFASTSDYSAFNENTDDVIYFVNEKYKNVTDELSQIDTVVVEQPSDIKDNWRQDLFVSEPYPNPANTWLKVDLANASSSDVLVALLDLKGQLVFSKTYKPIHDYYTTLNLNLSDVNSGVYILRVATGNGLVCKKISVRKHN